MKRDALFNMIEQQIRPWDVHDPRVLKALHDVPRASFLPSTHQAFAYVDTELPLVIDGVPTGTRLLAPRVIARIVQSLELSSTDHVALIGLGDGYLAALMALFAHTVTAYELDESIMRFAQKNLNAHSIRNVNFELSDGLKADGAHYDAIVLAGAVPYVPEAVKAKLNVGARLFAIVGVEDEPTMHAILMRRHDEQTWSEQVLFETVVPSLTYSRSQSSFVF